MLLAVHGSSLYVALGNVTGHTTAGADYWLKPSLYLTVLGKKSNAWGDDWYPSSMRVPY